MKTNEVPVSPGASTVVREYISMEHAPGKRCVESGRGKRFIITAVRTWRAEGENHFTITVARTASFLLSFIIYKQFSEALDYLQL